MTIKRPEYVVFNTFGELDALFCKMCGSQIGGMNEKVQGRRYDRKTNQWIEERVRQFRRNSNYAEMKIEFDDGSFHVTNGCTRCMRENVSPEVLAEMHSADMDMEERQGNKGVRLLRKRVPTRVVAIRTDGGGVT